MEKTVEKNLDNFFIKFEELRYKKYETLLRAEDIPSGVYYLVDGYVRLYSITQDGRELTLNIFKPGSYFPLAWAIANSKNIYFYQAITNVLVRRAPKKSVVKFLGKNPEILFELNKRLLIGMDGLLIRIQYLLLSNALQKIASTFLMLAARFGEITKSGILVNLPLTHQDIASLAGVTRETTTLEINKFEKQGLIGRRKQLYLIKNIKNLKILSQIVYEGRPLPYTF